MWTTYFPGFWNTRYTRIAGRNSGKAVEKVYLFLYSWVWCLVCIPAIFGQVVEITSLQYLKRSSRMRSDVYRRSQPINIGLSSSVNSTRSNVSIYDVVSLKDTNVEPKLCELNLSKSHSISKCNSRLSCGNLAAKDNWPLKACEDLHILSGNVKGRNPFETEPCIISSFGTTEAGNLFGRIKLNPSEQLRQSSGTGNQFIVYSRDFIFNRNEFEGYVKLFESVWKRTSWPRYEYFNGRD